MKIRYIYIIKTTLVLLLYCCAQRAYAFNFVPEGFEFNSWDKDCKAIYAGTPIGKETEFANLVPKEEVKKWYTGGYVGRASQLGGIWHYCASLIWLNRARNETASKLKKFDFTQAMTEALFSYRRCPQNEPFRAVIGTALAHAYYGMGETDKAKSLLKILIENTSDYSPAYSALSLFYKKEGHKNDALNILLKGNTAVNGKSSEIHYFLGLLYLELGDLEKARQHANEAYKLGYPLPGLKNKLKHVDPGTK